MPNEWDEVLGYIENGFDFGLVSFPVFGWEGPEGNIGDTEIGQVSNDRLDGLFSCVFMTFDRIKTAVFRPATVAVHNDGNMI